VNTILDIIYWVELSLLVIVIVMAVIGAVRGTGTRSFVPWKAVVQMVAAIVGFAAMVWFTEPGTGVVWMIVLIVVGVAVGYLIGGRESVTARNGRAYVHRSPLAPWVWAIAVTAVVLTLLFGSSYLFALAMLILALGLGLTLGQLAGEWAATRRGTAAVSPAGTAD